jgi:hypothetical protein
MRNQPQRLKPQRLKVSIQPQRLKIKPATKAPATKALKLATKALKISAIHILHDACLKDIRKSIFLKDQHD